MILISSIVATAILLFLSAVFVLKRSLNVDRTLPEYLNRKIDFWNGNTPHTIHGNIEYHDLKFTRYLVGNDREEEVPYLLDYALYDVTDASALIILPGGSYAFRSEKTEGIDVAKWLNTVGISAFVLNYRVDPYKHPAPLEDVTQAIRYLRANAKRFHINPERIGVMGFSAGGHLAASLGTHYSEGDPLTDDVIQQQCSRPDVMILCYPVITMLGEYSNMLSRNKLLGNDPSDGLAFGLSCEKQVTSSTPPTFIWTTMTDARVDYHNSELFVQSLKACGVPHEYHLFPKGRHGQGLAAGKDIGIWTTLCIQWLRNIGFMQNNNHR